MAASLKGMSVFAGGQFRIDRNTMRLPLSSIKRMCMICNITFDDE
jgi:hypothetical protein